MEILNNTKAKKRSQGIAFGIFRLLCFFDGDAVVVLTYAFQKKTQKTPKQAITTAEKRMNDYFRRKAHE